MNTISAERIRQALSPCTHKSLAGIEVFREIGSTNSYLLEAEKPMPGHMRVALAEQQTAGRGRQDKSWYSPPGAGLWMSIAYSFTVRPANLSALTLAVGSTVANELAALGVAGVLLKWPNDLLIDERKLGGILLESCANGMTAVVGIGINMLLPKNTDKHIKASRPAIDLDAVLAVVPSIDILAARVIERLRETLQTFGRDGFASFAPEWSKLDALAGREIVVDQAGVRETGTARGIAPDGALLLHNGDGLRRVVSGSVSIVDRKEAVA
ncbi:MAG: biotin--[acetyl-CoA-carboxylase] ligase [Gammaproteobacteria bacterium]|nr:biotin--[acetyl-CoA-carboxylase] ligase [Gammaproteobacteria bacterium]